MTVDPPVVQPSLGEIALMQGTADAGYKPVIRIQKDVILVSLVNMVCKMMGVSSGNTS